MRKFMNSEQSGRSMVEMLGVLAIIGVLSVGGISGYSKAMAKFKMSKAMDQMSMLVANIRTTYASMATYNGLTTQIARDYGLASRDMFGTAANSLVNAFGGQVYVSAVTNNGMADTAFAIVYNGLDREACMGLATADWGSAGLVGITISNAAVANEIPNATAAAPVITTANMPVSLAVAGANGANACSAQTAVNSITWYYY